MATEYLRFSQYYMRADQRDPQLKPGQVMWARRRSDGDFDVIPDEIGVAVIARSVAGIGRAWRFDEHDEFTVVALEDLPGEVCATIARLALEGNAL